MYRPLLLEGLRVAHDCRGQDRVREVQPSKPERRVGGAWGHAACGRESSATSCRSRRNPLASSHPCQVTSFALATLSHSYCHLSLDMDAFKIPESFTEDDDQRFLNDTDLQPALDFVFYTSKILKENEGFLVG